MTVKDPYPALRAFLLADATVSTLVGAARIYPLEMPQGERRASLVYQEISSQGDHHNEGPSGLGRMRLQIAVWAETPPACRALAAAVKGRIDGYRGAMGSGGDAITVQGVFFDSSRDLKDADTGLIGKSMDFFFIFDER